MFCKIKRTIFVFLLIIITIPFSILWGQKNFNGSPLFIDVNAIKFDLKKLNGEGQFTTQYSWMLTGEGSEKTEIWYWPQDQWHSQMLYQIFNPVCLDDNGIIDQLDQHKIISNPFVSTGRNDFSWERRRYRTPYVTVNGIPLYREYRWEVDSDLESDIVAVWEDILPYWGIRTHIEVYAFSNPNHQDYIIWKATFKFTGETKREIENPDPEDFFPDQTIRLWWPISFSFGPSKAGEYESFGNFTYEGEDDLDSWVPYKSELVTDRARDTLKIAYYWDSKMKGIAAYPNGSVDDTGDPDRVRVVPNPATIEAGFLGFPGEKSRILFTKLPYKCKLTVFTETGDRIIRLNHFGTDQEVWDQRTDNNQYVTSGIYVLAVTEAKDVSGKSLPDQFVKFILVLRSGYMGNYDERGLTMGLGFHQNYHNSKFRFDYAFQDFGIFNSVHIFSFGVMY